MITDAVPDIPPLGARALNLVTDAIIAEIGRVDRKARAGGFGGTHIMPGGPDDARISIAVEEVGEVARELNEARHGNREDRADLYTELIQLAGTAAAWAAAILENR